MESLSNLLSGPWAIGGDFNAVLESDDRSASQSLGNNRRSDFVDEVHHSGLIDAGFVGNRFTWSNNRSGLALTTTQTTPLFSYLVLRSPNLSGMKMAEEDLNRAERRLKEDPSDFLFLESAAARRRLAILEQMEEVFWKQKAQNSWLQEGDRNTRFFHALATWKIRHSAISSIKLADGSTTSNLDDIRSVAVVFFEQLFHEEPISLAPDLLLAIPSLIS
ncbi:uncharacterized protein LOC131232433 [Magnolia sinica]|uniref:uncharacterized protein LOC131232433 n=1 Tax=Magnolia sinica TaxID=86752 RepID=UPI002658F7DA|nr:uncharacterized protein LOC131232433 [Magnolia sinica]